MPWRLCSSSCLSTPIHTYPHLFTLQASTLGALEALLEFLSTKEVNIAVAGINIGPVHKKDVMRANVMNERSENGRAEKGGDGSVCGGEPRRPPLQSRYSMKVPHIP